MKIQDIAFFLVLFILVIKNNFRVTLSASIFCILLSLVLFAKWIFFTAERLTWYAAFFIFLALIELLLARGKK